MPFKKIATALEILESPEKASNELRKAIADLKKKKLTAAKFIFEHFPGAGSQSHAVFAIAKALIVQHKTTDENAIKGQYDQLLVLLDKQAKENHSDDPNACGPTTTPREFYAYIERLVLNKKLKRTPSGVIS